MPLPLLDHLGIVVIGRNEGERLVACLEAILAATGKLRFARTIYVDSGSTDGSAEAAERMGVAVIRLDPTLPFTAARGRNEGFAALHARHPGLAFVQFIDGDTELAQGWCETALAFLAQHADVAITCGRLRERHPERSLYNELCGVEWEMPAGPTNECGGTALMRADAFAAVAGFRPQLAGGEEPELCVRLRENGWAIWRLDVEMAVHDSDMTCFRQWWSRMVRNGTGFIQIYVLHRNSPYAIWKWKTARAVLWGGLLPFIIAAGSLAHPAALALSLVYPAQIGRIAMRKGANKPFSWRYAFFMTLGKFAEFLGMLRFVALSCRGRGGAPIAGGACLERDI